MSEEMKSYLENERQKYMSKNSISISKAFERGFQAAIESEQVQGLVEAAQDMIKYTNTLLTVRSEHTIGLAECARNDLENALEKFRGGE